MSVSDPGARAHQTRAYLRDHRQRSRPTAYQVYVGLLVGAVLGALLEHAVATLVGGGLSVVTLSMFGPAVVLLVLLGAARFGSWQGPVAFSSADVALLLTAPIAIAVLVRPKLDHGLLWGAVAGAVAGLVLVLVMTGGPAMVGIPRLVGSILGVAAGGVLAVAVSWLVQSSRRAVAPVRRAGPVILVAAVGLLVAGAYPLGRSIAIWSGPWGWVIAPAAGQPGWPLAVILIIVVAAAATVWARRRAGAVSAEGFLIRAETRSRLGASAVGLDYRGAAVAYREARRLDRLRSVRLPRPRRRGRVILWRDATALTRDLPRLGWAALLCAAATLEALTHAGAALPAALASGGLYVAASLMLEPLRVDVDDPDRAAVLLSWPFARLLIAHCTLPFLVLLAVATAAIVATVLAGLAGLGVLLLVPTVLSPVIAAVVLCSAFAARRGGRLDQTVLARLFTIDPANPFASVMMAVVLAPWLFVAVLIVGGALLILGAPAAHHHPLLDAGILATLITCTATAILAAIARRSRPPTN